MIGLQENSLTQYLDLVKPWVSDQLIDATHWSAIAAIAAWLPSRITNFFGFECRLSNPAPQADFLLCVGNHEMGQQILAGQLSYLALQPKLLRQSVWQQVQQFSQIWLQESSCLAEHVNNIWLEFDVDGFSQSTPIPSCFFGSQSIQATPTGTNASNRWVTEMAITQLQGSALDTAIQSVFSRCLDSLPVEAHVFQVGLMLARSQSIGKGLRICLRGLSPQQTLTYLEAIGWQGDLKDLEVLLLHLATLVERIDLDLDLGLTGVQSKIGLECYLLKQPKFDHRWLDFLNYLVQMGWCLSQKRDALLSYPGVVRETRYLEQWPSHLRMLSSLSGRNAEGIFGRGLHHVKLTYDTHHVTEAKAYCWVSQQIIRTRARTPSMSVPSSP